MKRLLFVLAACGSKPEPPAPTNPVEPVALSPDAAPPAPPADPEVWLRGSTHVHAKASGDSKTPLPEVIEWYETRGYDFLVRIAVALTAAAAADNKVVAAAIAMTRNAFTGASCA